MKRMYCIDSCKGFTPNLAVQSLGGGGEKNYIGEAGAFGALMSSAQVSKFSHAVYFHVPLLDGKSCTLTSGAMLHLGIQGVHKLPAAPAPF